MRHDATFRELTSAYTLFGMSSFLNADCALMLCQSFLETSEYSETEIRERTFDWRTFLKCSHGQVQHQILFYVQISHKFITFWHQPLGLI